MTTVAEAPRASRNEIPIDDSTCTCLFFACSSYVIGTSCDTRLPDPHCAHDLAQLRPTGVRGPSCFALPLALCEFPETGKLQTQSSCVSPCVYLVSVQLAFPGRNQDCWSFPGVFEVPSVPVRLARESVGGLVLRGFGLCGSCVCLVCPVPPVFLTVARLDPWKRPSATRLPPARPDGTPTQEKAEHGAAGPCCKLLPYPRTRC